MPAGAIGHIFHDGRAEIAPRAFDRPFRHRMDGQIVIAIDAQRRNAEAVAPRRKSAGTAARNALKGGNSPLVVDDVHHHRGLVGRGEDQCGVEIAFRRRAVTDPCGGNLRVVADGRCHRPADGLRILRRQIAGNGEKAMLFRGIHHRKLAAFQRVLLVGEYLVHHRDEGIVVRDEKARLAVGREIHVALAQRLAEGATHRLFTQMLHVERGFALTLRHHHARIIGTQHHHVTKPVLQFLVGKRARPWANRLTFPVQHADDAERHIAHGFRLFIDFGPAHAACTGNLDVGEIRRITRAPFRLGNMQ